MADNIEIPFTVDGQAELVAAMNAAAKASETAAKALETQGKAAKFALGPNQKLASLQEQMGRATRQNNVLAQKDVSFAIARTQKQLAKQEGGGKPNKAGQLTSFIRSMRFGADGAMPLVGQAADLLGLGELVGPIGILGAAAKLAAEGLQSAAEAGNRMGTMMVQTGSNSTTSAALSNLGYSGDAAKAFNDRITSDPSAMAVASRFGVNNAPGMYGSQDWGGLLLKAIKGVRAEKDPVQRLRDARALGIDDNTLNLSDNTFNRKIGADANQAGGVFTSDYAEKSAEFTASLEHMGQAAEIFTARLAGPSMNGLTKFFNEASRLFSASPTSSLKGFFSDEDKYGNKNTASPLDKNTDALKENTQALGIGQRQYGHGERADAAIPRGSGMGSGYAVRRNLEEGAYRLGAFG